MPAHREWAGLVAKSPGTASQGKLSETGKGKYLKSYEFDIRNAGAGKRTHLKSHESKIRNTELRPAPDETKHRARAALAKMLPAEWKERGAGIRPLKGGRARHTPQARNGETPGCAGRPKRAALM